MLNKNVIPNACQNPIGLIPSTAPTRALFQSNCVGQAKITAVINNTPIADPKIANFSITIIRSLMFLLMNPHLRT